MHEQVADTRVNHHPKHIKVTALLDNHCFALLVPPKSHLKVCIAIENSVVVNPKQIRKGNKKQMTVMQG